MEISSLFKKGKSRHGIMLLLGILSAAAIITVAIFADEIDGDIIYPAAEAESRLNVVETEDGTLYFQDDGGILSESEYESGGGSGNDNELHLLVNINEASAAELMLIPGIGEIRAQTIIEYREITGGFNAAEELLEVQGIGEKLFEQIRPYCTIEGPRVQSIEPVSDNEE